MKKRKLSLAGKIFIGLVLGIILGIALTGHPNIAINYIKPFGTIFLNLLKFIVVPVVLCSIICGIISMNDIHKVGSIGIKTLVYYFCTTAFAIFIGLSISNVCKGFFTPLSTSGLEYEAAEAPALMDTIINIFPSNIIDPMLNANMLQVIVIAILFGFGIILAGEQGKKTAEFFESLNEVCMKIMDLLIQLSPYGVFCLITPVIAENGPSVIGSLAKVLAVAYICFILHATVVYSTTVKTLAGLNPIKFFKGMLPAMMMAFSSASSVGTLPLNKECAQSLGADEDVTSFVIPLGATINMDGTAIYQGVCAMFIATCYGIHLTLPQQLTIILTATLASIGTAGVPGAGMIMLTMVLQSVGLPVEGIALVAGIDRLFDMGRTTVNITGDASCAIIVSKLEEKRAKKKLAKN